MPFRFLSQLLRRKQDQKRAQTLTFEFETLREHIYSGKFWEALQKIELMEKIGFKEDYAQLKIQILKSLILTRLNNHLDGLKLAEEVLKKSKQIQNPSLEVEAYISKITALIELGDFSNSLEAIEEAERLQLTIHELEKDDSIDRNATLNYLKGKAFRKEGNLDRALKHLQHSLSIHEKEQKNRFEIADIYNDIGIIFATKGKLDLALDSLEKSLLLFQKLGLKQQNVKILNNIGMIYGIKRDHNKALDYYQRSLALSEEIENKQYIAALSLNIGLIHRQRGDLNSALDFFQKGRKTFEELELKSELATCFNNIGIVHNIKGELDLALQFFQKSLVLAEELENKRELSTNFQNIGNIFEIKGDYETAISYYKKSLEISKEIGNNLEIADLLFNLIAVSVYSGSVERASEYLEELRQINNTEENHLINQKYRLVNAIVLRTSSRIVKKAEAQQLFQEISQEEILDIQITITALLNLCELLILELKASGSEEVLEEVKSLSDRLLKMAKEQHSYLWLAETYLLQSKIALLELNLEKSQNLINQAKIIAEQKGLDQLQKTISLEHNLLFTQLNKWNKIIEQEPTMNEILELTQFEQFLERMVYKKLYCKEEEIQQYAEKARLLVEKWEKHS